jgi:FtsZ-interacting cell division protein YlmF
VIEKRDLGNPETVIIHIGMNDFRATRNLDFVMGEVYTLAATAKSKCPKRRLVLIRVL